MLKRLLTMASLVCISFAAQPQEQTTWKDAKVPMNRLLDDGWAIQSSSSVNTNWQAESGHNGVIYIPRESPIVYPRKIEINFVLTKNGRWMFCTMTDPSLENGATSRCRHLN
jgi:hypothetical protein